MVKLGLNFTSKGSYISKIIYKLFLELSPFGDVDEGASLVLGHGLEHDLGLGSVIAVGEEEDGYVACKPGIKVIRLATPSRRFHPGKFQADGLRWLTRRRQGTKL